MIFTRTTISRHNQQCSSKKYYRNFDVNKLEGNTFKKNDLSFLDKEFYSSVYDRMQNDEIKKELAKDIEITYIGNFAFKKYKNNRCNKKTPSDRARRVIRILIRLKKIISNFHSTRGKKELNLSQIFSLDSWILLEKAINSLIYKKVGNQYTLQRRIAILLKYAIEDGCKLIISFYTMYRPDTPL